MLFSIILGEGIECTYTMPNPALRASAYTKVQTDTTARGSIALFPAVNCVLVVCKCYGAVEGLKPIIVRGLVNVAPPLHIRQTS